MSWGAGPAGSTPWGDGDGGTPAGLALVAADAVRENCIRLTFNNPVYFSRWHDPHDASFINRYTVTEDPTAIGLDHLPSRPVAPAEVRSVFGVPTQIDVWLDRAMSPYGAKYTVGCVGLVDVHGVALDTGFATAVVDGVRQGAPVVDVSNVVGNRDIANPQMTGVYQYDDTGDYGVDEGLASYKKRVFRRLTSRKGTFRHLPGYGVLIPQSVKKLARANLVDGIAADAEDQVRQEPETKDVTVQLVPNPQTPGLYLYRVRADTTLGAVNLDAPVPVGV